MADERGESWRERLDRKKNAEREQIEGFFDTWRGRIFAMVGVAIAVGFLLWNVIAGLITSVSGG